MQVNPHTHTHTKKMFWLHNLQSKSENSPPLCIEHHSPAQSRCRK